MTRDKFHKFCKSLPMTNYIVQWRGSHVWKIGGRVFAIYRCGILKNQGITFKVSEITYECMKTVKGIRPAPYFASRGMKWLQYYGTESELTDDELRFFLAESYLIVANGLTKKKKVELGIDTWIMYPYKCMTIQRVDCIVLNYCYSLIK